jgi:hypothetical protein
MREVLVASTMAFLSVTSSLEHIHALGSDLAVWS